MKLGIILNTSDPETAWNALRLGSEVLAGGNEVDLFLLGDGVLIEDIRDEAFDVAGALEQFLGSGGNPLACGTCLTLRHLETGVCTVSSMSALAQMILTSDKTVTFG